mmetsp:Transcript_14931/g.29444  ORF Transcript_14931/g.29444 Transcript_14931/m.29444 type:complete len:253 (-) Transcript_14931:50-808(-)|eukprot:CAMPEP_0172839454 /NCGR_PEP_ID=MMETSP1075-20121228/28582_1 /TAXON_ID=2916 /ORGANISM="Ceratium fusus, Strain PA161109" /LENGTH=252 /DNA_ID=CAMNT_0013683105 /DNA_START=36 /DNA_END=794 /DNA_ORIENTATION=-
MAFRGDIQGGQPTTGFLEGGLANLAGSQHLAGIEKTLRWKWLFFGGALIVFVTGISSVIFRFVKFEWQPATLTTQAFLLVFGSLMMVLDFPIPHPHKQLVVLRDHCYKFMLFMTRFMGRGLWYLFLGTLVFQALWDYGLNWFFGFVFTFYLVLLGVGALFKGWRISTKLHQVREMIVNSGRETGHFIGREQNGLSKEQFRALVEQVTNQNDMFTNDELDYVINALSFTPYNDGQVSVEECEYWLQHGSMLLV